MSLQEKYRPVLDLGLEFGVKDGYVEELDGRLRIGGTTNTQFEKNQMWDKIKEIGGENPHDLEADIKVEITEYFHKHIVASGDSLSKIAGHYYGKKNVGKYMHIFEANNDILKNPNIIHPDQELTIPFPDPNW